MYSVQGATTMSRRDRIEWLLTAINAVEDLVQPKLDARRKENGAGAKEPEQDQELQICMEELRVAAEELAHMRDNLELERQRYAELFHFAPDAYLETDSRWNIREANRAAAELLCCPQDSLVGKPLVVFVAEAERRRFRAMLAALEKQGAGGPLDWESRMQTRDGQALDVLVRASAARDADGRVASVRCMVRAPRNPERNRGTQDESARESR
jgi:PAS domain S-box-containing protein